MAERISGCYVLFCCVCVGSECLLFELSTFENLLLSMFFPPLSIQLCKRNKQNRGKQEVMDSLQLHDFIGSTLYIFLGNGRILKGSLVAIDAQLNLLLDHVFERNGKENERSMGLVSVPEQTIKSIKMTKPSLDRVCHLKQDLMRQII